MLPFLWLIPLLPLLGFAVVGYLGASKRLGDRAAHSIAIAASALAFVVALLVVVDFGNGVAEYTGAPRETGIAANLEDDARPARFSVTLGDWLPPTDTLLRGWAPDGARQTTFSVGWTFAVDALTCVMLLVVTGIGTLIHVYSVGYMKGERGYWRFFAYLNLFMSMMLTLVLAGNFLVMFVGWEGVGLCSYLLIGFYYDRMFDKETNMSCADAGRKAFITNRIGDFGFMLGMLLILVTFGTWDFAALADAINGGSAFWYGSALLTGIGLLLFVGATGKSAQIPLYVWLPDAMAGPTPVSALIHAATMVTAGVYMLARTSALYWHAPAAMAVVAVVGCLTAVFAGSMGMAQYDIKKVLAYSTVSQLGYMFLGVGVGAFAAAIFHLVTHAFFKACLFLGAGSVIARVGHSNDMRHYGGLRRYLPTTRWTFLVATLAISGVPFLSGFMSKDEILAKSLFSTRGSMLLWLLGTLGAVMTSFYMFRAYQMTFEGSNRTPEELKHGGPISEAPKVMTNVLATLAIGAVAVGFVGVPEGVSKLFFLGDINWFAHQLAPVVKARGVVAARAEHGAGHEGSVTAARHGEETHTSAGVPAGQPHDSAAAHPDEVPGVLREGLKGHPSYLVEAGLFLLATAVFGIGFLLARWAFGNDGRKAQELAPRLAWPRRLLHRKWFVDEAYDVALIRPFHAACRGFATLDRVVVDGAVNLSASVTEFAGQIGKLFQTGVARHYALWLLFGAVVVVYVVTR